jgi:DNA polymerase III gamma/tau subunit
MNILPWHKRAWERLTAANLHHALLLIGKEGTGVEDFAKSFANFLLNNQHDLDLHPDFLCIQAQAAYIVIDQIRSIIDFAYTSSHNGGAKVILIADAMNTAASNALLKILEEPPANVYFLLLNMQHNILPTIYSRCQKIYLSDPTEDMVNSWLQDTKCNAHDIALAKNIFGARIFKIHDFCADEQYKKIRNDLCELFLCKQQAINFLLAEKYNKKTDLWPDILFWLYAILKDIIVYKLTNNKSDITNYDLSNNIINIVNYYDSNKLFKFANLISAEVKYINTNTANPQVFLESLYG